jgi:cytochrome c oxidase cbb3-type subunit I/II
MNANAVKTTIVFDDRTVRHFTIASMIWGFVGILVGLIAATQLSFWQMNGRFLQTITGGRVFPDDETRKSSVLRLGKQARR